MSTRLSTLSTRLFRTAPGTIFPIPGLPAFISVRFCSGLSTRFRWMSTRLSTRHGHLSTRLIGLDRQSNDLWLGTGGDKGAIDFRQWSHAAPCRLI